SYITSPVKDLNGDGLPDLAYVLSRTFPTDPFSMRVKYSSAAGLFAGVTEEFQVANRQSPTLPVGILALGDLSPANSISRPDLVIHNEGVFFRVNSGSSAPVFTPGNWVAPEPLTPLTPDTNAGFSTIKYGALVDVNGDCAPDILGVTEVRPQRVEVVGNNG